MLECAQPVYSVQSFFFFARRRRSHLKPFVVTSSQNHESTTKKLLKLVCLVMVWLGTNESTALGMKEATSSQHDESTPKKLSRCPLNFVSSLRHIHQQVP